MKGRLVITGASGFVGRHLVAIARDAGWAVRPVARAQSACAGDEVVRSPREEDWAYAFRDADVVVHLAARAHRLRRREAADSSAFERINVNLTERVCRAAIQSGVRRLILLSSAGVLGNRSPKGGFADDSPPSPHDAYTRSKLNAELRAARFSDRLDLVILRAPLVYGPDAPGNFGRLVAAVRRRLPIPSCLLNTRRSMIGVRNLCDALMVAAENPHAPGAPMLVSDLEDVKLRDVVRAIADELAEDLRIVPAPLWAVRTLGAMIGRSSDVRRLTNPLVLQPKRMTSDLGWAPPFSWREEVAWSIAGVRARQC